MQLGAWSANVDPLGRLALYHISRLGLLALLPVVHPLTGPPIRPAAHWEVHVAHATSLAVTHTLAGAWQIIRILRFEAGGEHLVLSASVRNLSAEPVALQAFEPLTGLCESTAPVLSHACLAGAAEPQLRPLSGMLTAWEVAGLSDAEGEHALLLGFTRRNGLDHEIRLQPEAAGRIRLTVRIHCAGAVLAPSELLSVPDLALLQGLGLRGLLQGFTRRFKAVAPEG